MQPNDVIYVSLDGADFIGADWPRRPVSRKGSRGSLPALAPDARPLQRGATAAMLLSDSWWPEEKGDSKLSSAQTGKRYSAFISHMKAEAAMEARFLTSYLEKKFEDDDVFIDSDDLNDLHALKVHVQESAVLVLIPSKSVLTRPWCLLELLTAIKHGLPVVGLSLCGGAAAYSFAEAQHFLANLDSLLEHACPGAVQLLAEHGWPDLTHVAYLLSTALPARISIPFTPG